MGNSHSHRNSIKIEEYCKRNTKKWRQSASDDKIKSILDNCNINANNGMKWYYYEGVLTRRERRYFRNRHFYLKSVKRGNGKEGFYLEWNGMEKLINNSRPYYNPIIEIMSRNVFRASVILGIPLVLYTVGVLYLALTMDDNCINKKCSVIINEDGCDIFFTEGNFTCYTLCNKEDYETRGKEDYPRDITCYQDIHDEMSCPELSKQFCTNLYNALAIIGITMLLIVIEVALIQKIDVFLKDDKKTKYVEMS